MSIEIGMAQELEALGATEEQIAGFLAASIKSRKLQVELFGQCKNGEPEDCECRVCNPSDEESEIIEDKSRSHSEKIAKLNVIRGRGRLIEFPSS